MRVVVCGGRHFGVPNPDAPDRALDDARALRERWMLERTLDAMHADTPFTLVIEGGASGADALAFAWASFGNRVGTVLYAADWKSHGRAAGPMRNTRMLDEGKPDLVVAFPGGKGTANMIKQAKARGVRVIEVAAETPSGPDKRGDHGV